MVTENEILIVDFKTNRTPPGSVAEAPAAYIRQLALYRALLQKTLSPEGGPDSITLDRNP